MNDKLRATAVIRRDPVPSVPRLFSIILVLLCRTLNGICRSIVGMATASRIRIRVKEVRTFVAAFPSETQEAVFAAVSS